MKAAFIVGSKLKQDADPICGKSTTHNDEAYSWNTLSAGLGDKHCNRSRREVDLLAHKHYSTLQEASAKFIESVS